MANAQRKKNNKPVAGKKVRSGKSKSWMVGIFFLGAALLLVMEAVSLFKTDDSDLFITAQFVGKFSGTGQSCGMFGAWDVAAVGNDKIAVADSGGRILYFDRSGKFLKSWGKKGKGPGDLDEPSGIVSDALQNVYFVDAWKSFIIGLDSKLKPFLTLPLTGFYGARGLAWDGQNFYVADTGTHRVVKLSPKGETIGVWGKNVGDGKNDFDDPRSVALDTKGVLYVADYENGRVQILDPTPGKFLKSIKIGPKVSAVLVDSKNRLFVASMDGGFVKVFTTDGKFLGTLKDEKGSTDPFKSVSGMGVAPDGTLLLASGDTISMYRVP